jgi:hypothetical protein
MRRAIAGEYYIGSDGVVRKCFSEKESMYAYPIIRKIEKPAKYRPFANAEEFKPHRDRWVRVTKEDNDSGCDLEECLGDSLKFMTYSEHSACASGGWLTYDEAFECFVFDDDGTPFGVRIDE